MLLRSALNNQPSSNDSHAMAMAKQFHQGGVIIVRRAHYSTTLAVVICIILVYLYITPASKALLNSQMVYESPSESPSESTNSTLHFQKIFAISLPSRTDRQDALSLMSVLSGIEIEIMPGVRGEDVLEKTIPKVSPNSPKRDFNCIHHC